jgi:hypothetical protein
LSCWGGWFSLRVFLNCCSVIVEEITEIVRLYDVNQTI